MQVVHLQDRFLCFTAETHLHADEGKLTQFLSVLARRNPMFFSVPSDCPSWLSLREYFLQLQYIMGCLMPGISLIWRAAREYRTQVCREMNLSHCYSVVPQGKYPPASQWQPGRSQSRSACGNTCFDTKASGKWLSSCFNSGYPKLVCWTSSQVDMVQSVSKSTEEGAPATE